MKAYKSPLKCELFLNCATDYSIAEHRKPVTLERARALYEAGAVDNCNLGFQRLAEFGFDIEKVKAYYKAARRG